MKCLVAGFCQNYHVLIILLFLFIISLLEINQADNEKNCR
nr:MAG TPA: hypothetical protein [Caudoviricetes sp.]